MKKGIRLKRLDNPEFKRISDEYIQSGKLLSHFYINKLKEPHEVKTRHRTALEALRSYLNYIDIFMPEPLFPYHIDKIETHRYVETKQTGPGYYVRTASNPLFAYDHLLYYKKAII